MLIGKLYDDAGNRMTLAHAGKGGVRYRYYVSSALSQDGRAGAVARVSAPDIEGVVLRALRERYPERADLDDCPLITGSVDRLVLREVDLEITLRPVEDSSVPGTTFSISWTRPRTRRRREIISSSRTQDIRPIRAETRATLVRSIALGRRWLQDIVNGATADDIAARQHCSKRHVTMMISLSFLAPHVVEAAMTGRLPRGIGVTRLTDPPIEWLLQSHMLGL